jgi:uncharacterized protein (TIGR02145 family)
MINLKLTWESSIILMTLLVVLAGSCRKDDNTPEPPVITTSMIFSLSSNAVTIRSVIKNDERSTITSQGICWSLMPNLTVNNNNYTVGDLNDSILFCRIEGLTTNTKYYARALATSTEGTGYGDEIEFTTNNRIIDIDGNIYNTVSLGTQVWIVENLKTTKYNDGTDIPIINTEWSKLITSGYCWYDFSVANKNIYGALYNWPSVDSKKLCPTGWHVPTNAEWVALFEYLGGEDNAGSFLKAAGTNWETPNIGATNYAGFCALSGGASSDVFGYFTQKGVQGKWWSSTIDYSLDAEQGMIIFLTMFNNSSMVLRHGILSKGGPINFLSVRCIKD